MRKQFKKALSMVLSAAMVLALGSGIELKQADAAQKDKACDAVLIYADPDWGHGNWNAGGDGAKDAKVDGDGTYTVSLTKTDATAIKAHVFCVDINDIISKVASPGALKVSDVKIKADGNDLEVDQDKIVQGHLEADKQNYRIEIYNPGGGGTTSKDGKSPIDKDFTWKNELSVTFTLKGTGWGDRSKERPTTVTDGDPDTILAKNGIHAYLTYQMDNWDHRNDVNGVINDQDEPYDDWMDKASGINYLQAGGKNSFVHPSQFTIKDVLLDHDGEYTVSVKGVDLSGAAAFNWLGVATDLDATDYPGVTATISALKIDDTAVTAAAGKPLVERATQKYHSFFVVNKYAKASEGMPLAVTDLTTMPEKSIEITFTIAGLDEALDAIDAETYQRSIKKGDYASTKPTPAPTEDPNQGGGNQGGGNQGGGNNPTPSPTPGAGTGTGSGTGTGTGTTGDATVGAKVGATVEVGSFKLKVTKAATAKTAGTATVTGLSKAGKKAKSLNVKATLTSKDKASYKINKIGKNAFKGAKATSITLNKSITTIPAGAFANCKKLNKLTLNAKLKKVDKKAFTGCKKKITVKGKSKKANVKTLKKGKYKKFK